MGKRAKKLNISAYPRDQGIIEIDARLPQFAALRATANGQMDNMPNARKAPTRLISVLVLMFAIFAIMGAAGFGAFTAFYLAYLGLAFVSLALRSAALFIDNKSKPNEDFEGEIKIAPLYSILIAIYKEEDVVPTLASNLSKLNWPKNRLDIIYLCEAEDISTQKAVKTHANKVNSRLIIVPKGTPKTKPRALNYGLAMARGRFLTIYDAEDQPHPNQLREAFECFSKNDKNLGMVQAPLKTNNERESFISAQFALDYAIWFRVLLPFFARIFGFIPLGGTSNHFRTSVLRKAGGWDAYNLTEDADLGIRLGRMGYYAKTINCPTFEEAPPHMEQWVKQRTRWIQGHLQTAAAHLFQKPADLMKMGIKQYFAAMFTIFAGPLFIFIRIPIFILFARPEVLTDIYVVIIAYALLFEILIAWLAIRRDGRRHLWHCFYTLPAYWILQTIAYLRANVRIFTKPFVWEKTAHGKRARQK